MKLIVESNNESIFLKTVLTITYFIEEYPGFLFVHIRDKVLQHMIKKMKVTI